MDPGQRVTLTGLFVNVALIGIKLAGGIWGHSQALVADAVHSLSDLATDVVTLAGRRMGSKQPDPEHPFGHARLETAAALLIGLALIGTAVFLGYEAATGIYHHQENHPRPLTILVAAISIGAKEWLYQMTVRVGRRLNSTAVIANAWHHRSDAVSSIAVLFGVVAAQIRPAWHILDAYAALLVSILIIKVGIDVMRSATGELTDRAPAPEVIERIRGCAAGVPGVEGVHDLKVRTSGGRLLMEIHVVVDGNMTVTRGHGIVKDVERCLFEEFSDMSQIIVHMDPDKDPGEGA